MTPYTKMESLEKEFEEAVETYGGIITKICYYFSSHSEEFKDLRQEVLYNIWKGWKNFRNDAKLSTWIYRVSFNTCVSFQRKEKYSKNKVPLEEAFYLQAETDNEYLAKYTQMNALIRKLGFEDRAIIMLWLDEKSYDEISELMGINRNTLAVRIKRIKEKLIKLSDK